MVRIPTLIPKTLVRLTRQALSGTVLDTLWRLFVVALLAVAAYALASLGMFGAAISGVILGTLVTEPAQNAVRDVWNRNFWVFRT
ncbi:hypothetical protein [Natrinema pallidum]|uniref:Uncharacterized protein n=1 Tax=Natrinema pallidum TaxID=69527 RepID=A0A4P9TLZ6_9EURY|nr:hypothetical protein [Natrinema pallidum]QCW05232.1 hypothetical protein FGF80_18460 [Natrinema pallidum]